MFSSVNIANSLNVPSFLIALTVIGIGASMPDITVGIKCVLRGQQDVGFGDALGSLTMKSLLFLGVLSIINPISINPLVLIIAGIFTVITLGLALYYSKKGTLNWKQGLTLIFLYILFILVEWFLG